MDTNDMKESAKIYRLEAKHEIEAGRVMNGQSLTSAATIIEKAADEIERLRAENEKWVPRPFVASVGTPNAK